MRSKVSYALWLSDCDTSTRFRCSNAHWPKVASRNRQYLIRGRRLSGVDQSGCSRTASCWEVLGEDWEWKIESERAQTTVRHQSETHQAQASLAMRQEAAVAAAAHLLAATGVTKVVVVALVPLAYAAPAHRCAVTSVTKLTVPNLAPSTNASATTTQMPSKVLLRVRSLRPHPIRTLWQACIPKIWMGIAFLDRSAVSEKGYEAQRKHFNFERPSQSSNLVIQTLACSELLPRTLLTWRTLSLSLKYL